MKLIKILASISVVLASVAAIAQDAIPVSSARGQLELEMHMAKIKSAADLNLYMRTTPLKKNPIFLLSPKARQEFLESLTFNQSGLTSYRYVGLEQELDQTQIYNLLTLFGVQRSTTTMKNAKKGAVDVTPMICNTNLCSGNVKDAYCASRATCSPRGGDTCIAANC